MDSVNNISFKLLGVAKHLSSSSFLVDVLNLRRSKLVLYLKFTGRNFLQREDLFRKRNERE